MMHTPRFPSALFAVLLLALWAMPGVAGQIHPGFFKVKSQIPPLVQQGAPAHDLELKGQYEDALRSGDGDRAATLMRQRIDSIAQRPVPATRAIMWAEYGQLLFSLGRGGDAEKALAESFALLDTITMDRGRLVTLHVLGHIVRDRFLVGDLEAGERWLDAYSDALARHVQPVRAERAERMILGQVYNAYRTRYILSPGRVARMESWLADKPFLDRKFESEVRLLLSIQYRIAGDLAKMEEHLEKACAIWKEIYGEDNGRLYQYQAIMGDLFLDFGDLDQAESRYAEGIRIAGAHYPQSDMRVTGLKERLARVRLYRGEVDKAEALAQEVIRDAADRTGQSRYDVAKSCSILAQAAVIRKDFGSACEYRKRAFDIADQAMPAGHPERLAFRLRLAEDSLAGGFLEEAETNARAVAEETEKLFGREHPFIVRALSVIGEVEARSGRRLEAYATVIEAERLGIGQARMIVSLPSDEQRKAYFAAATRNMNVLLGLAGGEERCGDVKEVYEVWLNRKGAFLDSQMRYQRASLSVDSEDVSSLLSDLAAVRGRLSHAAYGLPDDHDSAARLFRELSEEKRRLTEKLNRQSAKAVSDAGLRLESLSLPPGSVLVDYVLTRPGEDKAGRYGAFVVNGDKEVRLFDLGETGLIDADIDAFRREMERGDKADVALLDAVGRRLCSRLYAPLADAVGRASHVIVVPDGEISMVPFEVLRTGEHRYLVEEKRFSYLASARELAEPPSGESNSGKVLIMANPRFSKRLASAGEKERAEADMALSLAPLPGTEAEARAIAHLAGKEGRLFMEGAATKATLFSHARPRILHLATHGFFFSGETGSTFGEYRSLILEDAAPLVAQLSLAGGAGPLLRSGVVLAGDDVTGDCGMLTSEEALGLDLRGTKLVTLSACDTGLGVAADADGVYGLRRAFRLAGAGNLVLSMWRVPDTETRQMMEAMYRGILTGNRPVGESLRAAMLGRLAAERERGRGDNPICWAGFVHYGVD